MKPSSVQKSTFKRPTVVQFVLMGVGVVAAVALYIFLGSFVSCWRLTSLPGIPPSTCSGAAAPVAAITPGETPVAGGVTPTPTLSIPEVELPPPWDGASRVNVLFMGYDYGDWSAERSCPCRTDTMIVFTLDPISHTAGMLSIPRDMWVSIPGFDNYNRINAANFLGDTYKLPGGGPQLAMQTVENFLGIPIQYYAMIDFTTFEKMIDTLGNVCLVIPEEITIDPLGPHNTETLQAGPDCLNGAETLAYARTRHTENDDMDRAARQQQVVMAIRDKLLSPNTFLNLVAQAPALYNELSGGFKTNMSLNDVLRLAVFAKDLPLDQIQKGVIDYTMSAPAQVTVDGTLMDILRPFPDKIRELVDKMFGGGSLKPMATGDALQLMDQEAATVLVVNGSGIDGKASATADYLKTQDVNVIGYGNLSEYPDQYNSPPLPNKTLLILHAGKPYTVAYLKALGGITESNQFIIDFDPNAPADIVLAVGADWSNSPAQ